MKNLMLIAFATLIMSMGSALAACPACAAAAKEAAKKAEQTEVKAAPTTEAKADTVVATKAEGSACCGSGCCDAAPKRASAGQLVTADLNDRSKANLKRVSEGQIVIADIVASNGCGCSGCGGCAAPAKAETECDGCKPAPKKAEPVASN